MMAYEYTLSIIKPDAVQKGVIGAILSRYEQAGLRIVATKMLQLSTQDAEQFYLVHKDRPFYPDLVAFMTQGPVVISVLYGDNAVMLHRDLMGATNPKDAAKGTIRADFADSIEANAVHGSDSLDNAKQEIRFLFSDRELVG